MEIKKVFTSVRVILLIIFLVLSVWTINPYPNAKGVAIRSVVQNSSASIANIQNPGEDLPPRSRERITEMEIDHTKVPIDSVKDYYDAVSKLKPNQTIKVRTNEQLYVLLTKPLVEYNVTDELVALDVPKMVNITEKVNGTDVTRTEYVVENVTEYINKTLYDNETGEFVDTSVPFVIEQNVTEAIYVNKTVENVVGVEDIGLSVYSAPTTNLRKGLDLQGGTRVLLEPEEQLTEDEAQMLKANMEKRLNIYGLSDINVKTVKDKPAFLGGRTKYILVEIPGANEKEVKDLISKQGKFEARIKNETVFSGGGDITYVCRSAQCSGLDPTRGCGKQGSTWVCGFAFSISLSSEAAKNHAQVTSQLNVITKDQQQYLAEDLYLYLDDVQTDVLKISADLKGREVRDISISGSGTGQSQEQAAYNALADMKQMQTVLITGSLPVKLNIVKTDNISPSLGEKFVSNSIYVGLLALLGVALFVFIRYKKIQIALPMSLILLSEVIMLLGFAAFMRWDLDIAAIAGILIAAGTGVDHLIVITDEALRGESDRFSSWKQKLKKAFFIITAAYFTTCVAMIPLYFAGAGLLKGFAFTTIVGVTLGVFIARPAFAAVIEVLIKK